MLSRRWMRRIASPKSAATEMTSHLVGKRDGLGLDGVGDEQPLDRAVGQALDRGLGEQAVAHHRVDLRAHRGR